MVLMPLAIAGKRLVKVLPQVTMPLMLNMFMPVYADRKSVV